MAETKKRLDDRVVGYANQSEAEVGSLAGKAMDPLRTKQAIDAQRAYASKSEAETGTDNSKVMTPLRVKEAIDVLSPPGSLSFTLEDPGASENTALFSVPRNLTVSQIRAVVRGTNTPSVTWNLKKGSDRSASGTSILAIDAVTNSTTTGSTITAISSPVISANDWVWLTTSAISGTVYEITFTISYA